MLVNCQMTVTTMIGPDDRQQDAAENLEEARAVDLRGAHQLGRKGLVVVAEEQRREAEAVDGVDQHQPGDGAGQAEEAEDAAPTE